MGVFWGKTHHIIIFWQDSSRGMLLLDLCGAIKMTSWHKYSPHHWPFRWGIHWILRDPQHKGPVMHIFGSFIAISQGSGLSTLKGFQQKAFSGMFGYDELMPKRQPITTKHSAKSFCLKPFSVCNAEPWIIFWTNSAVACELRCIITQVTSS